MRAIWTFVLIVATSSNAFAADALKGETLAKRWCASCHVVSQRQIQGTTLTPPFSEIAKKPDFSKKAIAYFLLSPHPPMPDMNLTRNEADDLAAYIATQ